MGSDFVVESKGHCFICLNKTQSPNDSPVKQHQHPEPKEHVSVHSLSRYLKLDMKKVFIDWELIPQHLIKEVEKARLKVELCLSCAGLIRKFSRLSRLLEKVEMEVISSVDLIQTLVNAEREGKSNELRRNQGTEGDGWADKLRILDVIRNDAIQKCSKKLWTSIPRVPTLNMTTGKISKEKSKLKPKKSLLKIQPPTLPMPTNLVKVEGSPKHSMSDDELDGNNGNNGQTNYGQDDWEMQDEDFTIEGGVSSSPAEHQLPSNDFNSEQLGMEARPTTDDNQHEFCEEIVPAGLTQSEVPKCLTDPRTGKQKCSICSNEFATASGFHLRNKNVHLKIKYKCKLCGKVFTRRFSCWSHYRAAHMGIVFKCITCGRIFTDKSNLTKHLKKCSMGTL